MAPQNPDDKQLAASEPDALITDHEHDDHVPAETSSEPVDPEEAALNEHRMTLLEHLAELRLRLRNSAIAFVVSMIASFYFVVRFFEVLTRPVRDGMQKAGFAPEIIVMRVTEPFWVYTKLAIIAGLLIASPLVAWELWKFIAPGLYKKEKKLAGLVAGSTALCFIVGTVFGWAVLCKPAAYYMMTLLHNDDLHPKIPFVMKPQLMMDEMCDFLLMTLAGCGAAFELPVVIATLGALGLVTTKQLWKFNKYAIVLATVLGAVLTPSTDPFTQMLLAVPLFLLYEISVVVVFIIERARKKRDDEIEKQYGDDDKK
jgi:sec-independent protein translocase protein TatC